MLPVLMSPSVTKEIHMILSEIDRIIAKHANDPKATWSLEEIEEFETMMTTPVWDIDEQVMEMYEDEMSRQDLNNAIVGNKGEV
jgi:hypothetical protein